LHEESQGGKSINLNPGGVSKDNLEGRNAHNRQKKKKKGAALMRQFVIS